MAKDSGYGAPFDRLAAVTSEALAIAGPGHWPSGGPDAVHVAVRAIDAHRPELTPAEPRVRRGAAAMVRAAVAGGRVRLRLTGLTLTPSGVMVCAYPEDDAADAFARRLAEELGDDGWFEADFHRDIWYVTVVHFADDLVDPYGLTAWIADRRDLDLGMIEVDHAALLRFRFNGRQPVRVEFARAVLAGASAQA